jgi:hypothetical protein
MKKLLLIAFSFCLTLTINAQIDSGNNVFGGAGGMFIGSNPTSDAELDKNGYSQDQIRKIISNKYIIEAYKPAYVDDFKQIAYLRYNLFEDQMEFVKDDNIYYLKKEIGRKVHFSLLNNTTYKVFELNGDLQFFETTVDGKNSLLLKKSVRYLKHKKATSTYGVDRLADFKRNKDELYLAVNNNKLIKIPTNKKRFFKIFGSKSSDVKSYMKKNRLNHKNLKDLKKAVSYFNTL